MFYTGVQVDSRSSGIAALREVRFYMGLPHTKSSRPPPGPPGSPRVDYIYPILYTNNYIYMIMTHFFIDIEYQTVNLVTPTTSARTSQNI